MEGVAPIERILVGVDGSASSQRALLWAAAEAERTGAVVQAVMIWDNPFREMWIPHQVGVDPLAHTRHTLEQSVKKVLGEEPPITVETLAFEGSPARLLVELTKGVDLLVVGNRGRGGFRGLMLGSVSLQCLLHAACPVVVVRGKAKLT